MTPTWGPGWAERAGNHLYYALEGPDRGDLILLRGVGEYYEVRDISADPSVSVDPLFDQLQSNGINLVRLFVYSGKKTNPTSGNFPFLFDAGKYRLYQFNPYYFPSLQRYIESARNHEIYVLISLFDFSDDINTGGLSNSAWYHANNHVEDYPEFESDQICVFFDIFSNTTEAIELKNAQKNFVEKVVNETKNYPNVIYEIANEPKCSDANVGNWLREVSRWTKDACSGTRLTACVASDYPHVDHAILSDPNVDIFARHAAYRGYNEAWASPTPVLTVTATPFPVDCDYRHYYGWDTNTLLAEASYLKNDTQYANPTGTPPAPSNKVRLVDTDGCHRGTETHNNGKPRGRDFDDNCMVWAFIGYLYGAGFNTKEAIHPDANDQEIDCTPAPGQYSCTFEEEVPYTVESGQPWAHSDDFWWEIPPENPDPCHNNTGFDVNLADFLESTIGPDCIPQNYILSAGFGKENHYSTDDAQLWMKLGKIWQYNLGTNPFSIARPNTPWSASSNQDPWEDSGQAYSLNLAYDDGYFQANIGADVFGSDEQTSYPFMVHRIDTSTWPFLKVSDLTGSGSLPSGMFSSGTSTDVVGTLLSNPYTLTQFNPRISDRLKRIWGFEIKQNNERGESANPRIITAGFNYSTLNNLAISGRAEIILTIFDPMGTLQHSTIQHVYIRVIGATGWVHDLLGAVPLFLENAQAQTVNEDGTGGLLIGLTFDFELYDAELAENWSGMELKVVGEYGESDIWPYFQIREGDLGQTYPIPPAGTYPIQTTLQQITSVKGYDDQPVVLELEAGDYYTNSNNPINLRENYRLIGESPESTIIHVDGSANGAFLNPGLNSRIENCTIQCGSKIAHCGVIFKNCIFEVNPIGTETVIAIDVEGRHNGSVLNCLFLDCRQVAHAGYDAVLNMTDCTIDGANTGVVLESNALGFVSNCIFNNDPSQAIIDISDTSELEIYYCCFANSGYLSVHDDALSNEADSFVDDPEFIDAASGDYRLKQPNIQYTFDETSPCIDTGRPMLFECRSSTSPDGSIDRDRFDIGYHYPAGDFEYVVPKYRASASGSNAWTSELAIQNPNEYELHVTLDYYNANGTQAGSSVDIAIDPHATYRHVLTSSNAPVTTGSIELKADGPLFGHCLQTYTHTTQGVRSFMTQIQRGDTGSVDVSSTSLCTGNWTAHWGGGTNVGSTEFIVKNYHDEPVVITVARFFDPNGNALVPAQLSNYTLGAHKMYSVTKSSGFALTWGSFRIDSDKPLVGEMVINSSNTNSAHYFSESVIMVPSTLFGMDLIAPMVKCSNAGAREYEDYIIVKNVDDSSVGIDITFTNADGTQPSPQPFPSTITLPVNGLYGIDVWSAFPSRYFEGSVRIESDGLIIGHNEVVGFKPNVQFTQGEMSIAGAELDSRYSDAGRFYVPACRGYYSTSESETAQIVLRNLDTVSTSVTINAFDIDGNYVSAKSVTTSIGVGATYSYSLSSTSGESIYSIEIDSDGPISGWSERQWQISNGTRDYYDANLVQYWK